MKAAILTAQAEFGRASGGNFGLAATLLLGLTVADALDANADYIDVIVNADVRRVDGVKRDPDGVRRLLASYARNVSTDAALRTIGRAAEAPLSEATLHDYLRTLRRLFLVEDQESWKPRLRSRVRLAATPKRHLADPSLAVAALGATPQRLLGPEVKLGHHWVNEGARNLLALRDKLSAEANATCGALVVVVADSPTYTRPDGVVVTSIASLGP